jgi:hypothetical protein
MLNLTRSDQSSRQTTPADALDKMRVAYGDFHEQIADTYIQLGAQAVTVIWAKTSGGFNVEVGLKTMYKCADTVPYKVGTGHMLHS